MSRIPRSHIATNFFHIITQGINKSYIFDTSEDINYYIYNMYKLTNEHKIKIIAYCIMNNHAHLLLQVENLKELSKYMQRLNTKYGKYYNYKYNKVGYVFRDRYKSEGIYSERQLNNCINYIYNNPVKAKICKHPTDYPYSNCTKIEKIAENTEFIFLDITDNKNEICKDIINSFLIENNIELWELKNDKKKLKQLLIILKNEYDISLRHISDELKINRETIRKIYNY